MINYVCSIICTKVCNMNCIYCYENKQKLNSETLKFEKEKFENSLQRISKFILDLYHSVKKSDIITVVLHGGEPLLIGCDLLSKLLYNLPMSNNIALYLQTNGTMIDNDIIHMLKEHNVSVSISLDGPALINDYFRKNLNYEGSFSLVKKGLEKLMSANINISILSTITKQTLNNKNMFIDFFNDLGLKCFINRCYSKSIKEYEISNEEFHKFSSEIIKNSSIFYNSNLLKRNIVNIVLDANKRCLISINYDYLNIIDRKIDDINLAELQEYIKKKLSFIQFDCQVKNEQFNSNNVAKLVNIKMFK